MKLGSKSVVVEAGIGTGRVTNLYIEKAKQVYGFDRAPHMLTKLKLNLSDNLHKIKLYNADNLYLLEPPEKGDIFIEGWSFGHTVVDNESNYERIVNVLVDEAKRLTKDDGVIIFIETLGSNSEIPKPSTEVLANFYTLLEKKYGFTSHEIRTDYKFATNAEAARITGFFFGKKFGEDVLKSKKTIIPEWTG